MHVRLLTWSSSAIAMLGAFLFSCDSRRVFEENREFPQRHWVVNDAPQFSFSIADTVQSYNLYYNIRNSLHYEWDRVFVKCTLTDSSGQELSSRLVYNSLFDPAGRPLGESGLGDLYDHQFPLLANYQFPYRGRFSILLTQFSRQDTLRGVLAVGVRVERTSVE